MSDMSVADYAAVSKNDGMFGNGGMWIFALLILLLIGNGGGVFGGGGAATGQDIQRAVDLNSIQQGQRDIEARVQEVGGELTSTIKDSAYSNLSEMRDIQTAMNTGFAEMQKCCCETQRNIDAVKYNQAEQTQKILDRLSANREADLLQRINQLETQNMFCGIPRINPYGYVVQSTCGGGCNGGCGC